MRSGITGKYKEYAMLATAIKQAGTAALLLILGFSSNALAQDYAVQWAPPVGTAMPVLEAIDQDGRMRNLENLAGENGLLIFLNRSADW